MLNSLLTFARTLPGRLAAIACLCLALPGPATGQASFDLYAKTNLVAWCIVPFDAKQRGPEERAAMLSRLGIPRLAYDYRAHHVPTFDAEMAALKRHDIELTSWWFPGSLNAEARLILDVLKRHGIRTQLWITGGGGPTTSPAAQKERVEQEAARIRPIAQAAAAIGCSVALYNHGGWFGEPDNQIEIIERLKSDGLANVGIVYNQHHGHGHLDAFAALLERMKPYLLALNLNGMTREGDKRGAKILPIGQGEFDPALLRVIRESGWVGPVGILNHTNEDAEARLLDNLDGLRWITDQLDGQPARPKPKMRSWKPPAPKASAPSAQRPTLGPGQSPAFGKALAGGMVLPGKPEFRTLPLTIECRARLQSRSGFNILVASDEKRSALHWELYSYAGSGVLSLYMPGRGGEFKSTRNICDGQWHALAAIIETNRVRLYVDGRLVADAPARPLQGNPVPGGLAFGRLVEGGIGCDGLVDDVRISRGVRPIAPPTAQPLKKDKRTIGLWPFDTVPSQGASTGKGTSALVDPWAVEDAHARAALPLYKTIPAAPTRSLTPALGEPDPGSETRWHRSLGDNASSRFSSLNQINASNVHQLKPAWTYHSKDGRGNIQSNPIMVNGLLIAPTVGHKVVAIHAATGKELWRFDPPDRGGGLSSIPARRGLLYWDGHETAPARILFTAGNWIHALDPLTGKPIPSFGQSGRAHLPTGGTAVGAIYQRVLVVPGFHRDVFGYDVATGKQLWRFHTIPQPGEYGHETWSQTTSGANCWGGMAMDERRGIAYIATGSPKPNFNGTAHQGDNLFANCVIALEALTGNRLWHFQEIRHDIWDLDIPAPPNLVTITREGRRIDAVAQVTKLGNTLLLDRLSGRPVFPFRLRRAPTSKLPGEWTAPYQPDLELPEPFSRQVMTSEDVTTRNEETADHIRSQLASANFGFFEPFEEGKATVLYGIHGGAEWTGAAFDPRTGWLYVSANELPWAITVFPEDREPPRRNPPTPGDVLYQQICASCHGSTRRGIGTAPALRGLRHRMTEAEVVALMKTGRNLMPAAPELSETQTRALLDFLFVRDRARPAPSGRPARPAYTHNGYPKLLDAEGYPACQPPWGTLNCIDLNTGKIRWKVPLGEYPELTAAGMPTTGTENFGGAMVTAGGLVFCAGTRDEKIRAFDARTGRELWSHKLPWGGYAPPATYEVDGRQFVVIAATGGGKLGGPTGDAYVAFALP